MMIFKGKIILVDNINDEQLLSILLDNQASADYHKIISYKIGAYKNDLSNATLEW
jgi:hypothetical protein